jgi:tetratricopeptide (TPR) repeat protein
VESYDKAIQINSKAADYFNYKGMALQKQKFFGEAMENYDKAIQINPNVADY